MMKMICRGACDRHNVKALHFSTGVFEKMALFFRKDLEWHQMNIVKWYKNRSFQFKLVIGYLVLALIPMLCVTWYSYGKTRYVLLTEAYQSAEQEAVRIEKNFSTMVEPYETILEVLYVDQMLSGYLFQDYSNDSYEDMFYYMDKNSSDDSYEMLFRLQMSHRIPFPLSHQMSAHVPSDLDPAWNKNNNYPAEAFHCCCKNRFCKFLHSSDRFR